VRTSGAGSPKHKALPPRETGSDDAGVESFVIWFAAMVFHVLGHLLETARLAPRDWIDRAHADIAGARWRQWAVAASVAIGVPIGLLLIGRANSWFSPALFH
jgi:hypothetical protein